MISSVAMSKRPKLTGITRRKHKKSKLGCPQCRERRVKCDERLPACQKCTSRSMRCGYLDFSPSELQMIRIAHWEAEGSDPSRNPIPSQFYNPQLNPVVVYDSASLSNYSFTRPVPHSSVPVYYNNYIPNMSIHDPSAPYYNFPIQSPMEFHSTPPLVPTNVRQQHDLESPFSPTLHYQRELQSFAEPSYIFPNGTTMIPLIAHRLNAPSLSKFPEFFDETLFFTSSRFSLLERIHSMFALGTRNITMFSGLLLQAIGSLLPLKPGLEVYFFKYKGYSMNYIIKNIVQINDSNAVLLLSMIRFLNSVSVFQQGGNVKDHFALATGPGSLLKIAYEDPSKFPKSFPYLKEYADDMLFCSKYYCLSPYRKEVLLELHQVLKKFGSEYIESQSFMANYDHITKQFESIIDIIEFCISSIPESTTGDDYPISDLFELLQRWYSNFPSECFTLGSRTPQIEKTFYLLWHTLMSILNAIFVGGRYIFTYFLDGYSNIYTFQKSEILAGLDDPQLIWYINYSCRIIAFFNRRTALLLKNPILNDPIGIVFDHKTVGVLETGEHFMNSFINNHISKNHYPNLLQDTGDPLNPSEEGNVFNELLENVNQDTSLLIDDYDPKYLDNMFYNQRILSQPANIEFIDHYIDDRKRILQRYTSK